MRYVALLLLAALLGCTSLGQSPEQLSRSPTQDALLRSVMHQELVWISRHSDYQVSGVSLPAVVYLDPASMQAQFYGIMTLIEAQRSGFRLREIVGIYNADVTLVTLQIGFDVEDLRQRVILVHELAHYAQDVSGKFDEGICPAELEPEAYRLQAMWCKERGFDCSMDQKTIDDWVKSQCTHWK